MSKFAIPTMYKGVRFRSRLEACYAAFFDDDEIQWPWRYEPIDLKFYIPDFIIDFENAPVLFEVKAEEREIDEAKVKIQKSGWTGEAIVAPGNVPGSCIGALLTTDPHCFVWDDADMFFCTNCGKVSLHAGNGSRHCRRCDATDDHVGIYNPKAAWIRACNRVQWRAA